MSGSYKDIGVSSEGPVGIVEIQRPPHNFFDNSLINQIADAFEAFDRDNNIRSYVLCAQGKSFCAGADFANRPQTGSAESGKHLYKEATRLFRSKKPSIGAIQGPAIGGGLGLALMPDFRVACPEARFAANFARLGFHHGFGLTVTLPLAVGHQRAIAADDIVGDELRQAADVILVAMRHHDQIEMKRRGMAKDGFELRGNRGPVVAIFVVAGMTAIDQDGLAGTLHHDAIAVFGAAHVEQIANEGT